MYKFIIAVCLVLLLAIAGYYFILPPMWAKQAPEFLQKNIGAFLVVNKSEFSRNPPELVLSGVHLRNRTEFGTGDAVTIDKINIVFANYRRDPMTVKSVTLQHIRGRLIQRSGTDNLAFLHAQLMERKYQTPRDHMADPVILGNVILHDIAVQNEQGTVTTVLPDKNLAPTGKMAENPPLQNVIIDILGTVVEQQQNGAGAIALNDAKEKTVNELGEAADTIKAIGDAVSKKIGDYLMTPAQPPQTAPPAPASTPQQKM